MISQINPHNNVFSNPATNVREHPRTSKTELSFSDYLNATYCDSGYSIPMQLLMPAWNIKEMLLKRNKSGLRRVFKQIAYLCLNSEKRVCYKKQATLGKGCGNFEGKELTRKQVGRLEKVLVELGLYKRDQFRSDESYDRMITPLGTVTYLLLENLIKFRPTEKMSQPKRKNVPAQFLRQEGNFYLNTTEPDSKRLDENPKPESVITQKIEKKIETKITHIDKSYRFDLPNYQEHRRIGKFANTLLAQMRASLRQ